MIADRADGQDVWGREHSTCVESENLELHTLVGPAQNTSVKLNMSSFHSGATIEKALESLFIWRGCLVHIRTGCS